MQFFVLLEDGKEATLHLMVFRSDLLCLSSSSFRIVCLQRITSQYFPPYLVVFYRSALQSSLARQTSCGVKAYGRPLFAPRLHLAILPCMSVSIFLFFFFFFFFLSSHLNGEHVSVSQFVSMILTLSLIFSHRGGLLTLTGAVPALGATPCTCYNLYGYCDARPEHDEST